MVVTFFVLTFHNNKISKNAIQIAFFEFKVCAVHHCDIFWALRICFHVGWPVTKYNIICCYWLIMNFRKKNTLQESHTYFASGDTLIELAHTQVLGLFYPIFPLARNMTSLEVIIMRKTKTNSIDPNDLFFRFKDSHSLAETSVCFLYKRPQIGHSWPWINPVIYSVSDPTHWMVKSKLAKPNLVGQPEDSNNVYKALCWLSH